MAKFKIKMLVSLSLTFTKNKQKISTDVKDNKLF